MLAAQNAFAQDARTNTTTTLPTVVVTAVNEGESLTAPAMEVARAELNTQPGGIAILDAEQFQRGRAGELRVTGKR